MLIEKLRIIILFLLIINNSIHAQNQTITNVEEAIESALKNSPQMAVNTLNLQKQKQLKSGAYLMPKAELGASFGQFNSRYIDQSYSISQGFNPFLSKVKKALASEHIMKSEYELDITKQAVIHHIKTLWNEYQFHQADLKLMQEKEAFYKKIMDYATTKYDSGESGSIEKSSAKFQYQNLLRTRQNHEAQSKILRTELEILVDAELQISDNTYEPEDWDEQLDSSYVYQHPLVKSLLQDILIANAQSEVQKADSKPELMLGYFIQSMKGEEEIDNEIVEYEAVPRLHGLQLGLSLPVFGKGYKALKNAGQTDALIAEAKAEQAVLDISLQLNKLKFQYKTEQSNLDFYTNIALPNAQLISENAQKAYEGGDIGHPEYIQALTTYFDTQLAYLEAIKSFNQIVYDIKYLINE